MRYEWRQAGKANYKELWVSGVGYSISVKPWAIYEHQMYKLFNKMNVYTAKKMFKYNPHLGSISFDRKKMGL